MATIVALLFATLVGSTLVIWTRSAETRAIRHLPAEERRALYERTLRTLHEPCATQPQGNGLRSFCRDQAEFVLQFPECSAECQTLARGYLGNPAK